ncbi:HVO_A0114 family putative DNA-binding protein [Natronobacterium texcoconense]|uniref:Predicted transcriptional regulator n=1 Tax=Natronobacterium texcoconense TaxID=1095778 RepID=A0A1H1FE30_NATTX|nr:helix-turn-helix domain-containing protein [Natronobacterium texcoconense]SDQ99044.1 Predicted transcriptional regulator [Natronobacterium texcoconense]
MGTPNAEVAVYRCGSCGDYALGTDESTCCDVEPIAADDTVPIDSPDEAEVMGTVFDVSETELEICRQMMAMEEATIRELTEAVDRDRSVVTRHLDHLVELGVVEKQSRVRSSGGRVNVYTHRPVDAVRRQFKLGLVTWTNEALDLVDDLSAEKAERLVDSTARGSERIAVEDDE